MDSQERINEYMGVLVKFGYKEKRNGFWDWVWVWVWETPKKDEAD